MEEKDDFGAIEINWNASSWNLGRPFTEEKVNSEEVELTGFLHCAQVNCSGDLVAYGTSDGSIIIAEMPQTQSEPAIDFHGNRISTKPSPRVIWTFDTDSDGKGRVILNISWADDQFGNMLACCVSDGCVKLVQKTDQGWTYKDIFTGQGFYLTDVKFSPPEFGCCFLTVATEINIHALNTEDNSWQHLIHSRRPGRESRDGGVVSCVEWCKRTDKALIAFADSSLKITLCRVNFETKVVYPVVFLSGHHRMITCMDWSCGPLFNIASGDEDGNILFWKAEANGDYSPSMIARFNVPVCGLSFHPEEATILQAKAFHGFDYCFIEDEGIWKWFGQLDNKLTIGELI